jgi:hypothetical protein
MVRWFVPKKNQLNLVKRLKTKSRQKKPPELLNYKYTLPLIDKIKFYEKEK